MTSSPANGSTPEIYCPSLELEPGREVETALYPRWNLAARRVTLGPQRQINPELLRRIVDQLTALVFWHMTCIEVWGRNRRTGSRSRHRSGDRPLLWTSSTSQ